MGETKTRDGHGLGKLMTTYTWGKRLPTDDKQKHGFRGWHGLEECVYLMTLMGGQKDHV